MREFDHLWSSPWRLGMMAHIKSPIHHGSFREKSQGRNRMLIRGESRLPIGNLGRVNHGSPCVPMSGSRAWPLAGRFPVPPGLDFRRITGERSLDSTSSAGGGDSMPGALKDKIIIVTALLCVQHVSSNISGCVSMSWSVVGDFSSGH